MKIIVNDIPSSLNKFMGRRNEWSYRAEKKHWTELISSLSKAPEKPFEKAKVTITYYFGSKRRHDPDNYCGKVIMDGLVAARVIKDDSFECIDLVLKGSYDKDNPRTEIEVENEQR